MRHTRKMVMIPEAEYQTLLNLMTKTGDELKNEKLKLDAKIATTLANPKLEPDIKQKRYNVLYKERRQMRDMLENRPQKVIVQNPLAVPPNVAPYLGINKIPNVVDPEANENKSLARSSALGSISEAEVKTPSQKSKTVKSSISEPEGSQKSKTSNNGGASSQTQYESATSPQVFPVLSKKDRSKIMGLIFANPEKFSVTPNGQILSNTNLPIRNSNVTASLDFLTGALDSPPRGHKFFENALRRDPETKKILFGQTGKGLKFAKKIRIIKTPGLKRMQPKKQLFKPQLWAKL